MDRPMPLVSWYTDFAACYGTIWLVMLGVALLSSSRIDAGEFGLFGFPIIALIYAFIRRPTRLAQAQELDQLRRIVGELESRLEQGH